MKAVYRYIRIIVLTLAATFIISFGLYSGYKAWFMPASDIQPLTVTIQSKDFSLRIHAFGEMQSSEFINVAVPNVPVNRLRLASIKEDGVRVIKGETIAEFDPAELDLDAMGRRADLQMALEKIGKGELTAGVEKSDIQKDKRLAELELQQIIEFLPRDEQIFARREIIEGQLNRDYTEQKLVYADARLQLKGRSFTLDEAILLLERSQANTRVGQVEKALASLKLLSPANGIIVYNSSDFFSGGYLMPGRSVSAGMSLFNLVNPEKMEAKIYVLEKDAGELKPGQTVTVSLDPFPGSEFIGKVKDIDRMARPIDRDSPVKYFQTIVSFDKVDMNLMKPGVKLKAVVTSGELKDVIVVPRSAILKKDSDFLVFIQKGPRRFEPVAVKLGQGDLIQVVISEGLSQGDVLALNPPDVKRNFTQKEKKANGDSQGVKSP